MAEDKVRHHFDDYFGMAEVGVYSVLAVLLTISALFAIAIASAGKLLWDGLSHWSLAADTLRVLDQLLIVLMLVEILHTVRISIRSHVLVTELFLIVGLIAFIRRILVITLEAATFSKEGHWSAEGAGIFRASIVEWGLLGLLILILVFSKPCCAGTLQDLKTLRTSKSGALLCSSACLWPAFISRCESESPVSQFLSLPP